VASAKISSALSEIIVRDWSTEDTAAIERMHWEMMRRRPENARRPFPHLNSPLFCIKGIAEDEDGAIRAAAAIKLTGELFLWAPRGERSGERSWESFRKLNEVLSLEARGIGLEQVSAWMPPYAARVFKARAGMLGWQESSWPNFTLNL
jgi:hypothetical protein